MATATEPTDVRELLREDPALAAGDIQRLNRIISGPQLSEARQELRAIEDEIAATDRPSQELLARAGIVCYVLGQHRKADEYLSWVTGENGAACYYHGLVLTALERHDEAEGQFADAAKYRYDAVECALRRAGAIRAQGRLEEAEQVLRSVSRQAASRAEYSYQMGCILADRGDTFGAIEYFERAADMDPRHTRALFRLAAENALRGNDQDAVRLYERSLARPPLHLGSLLNLGLLYEDQENYGAAAYCFRKVLEYDPTHARARLYLKDIEAAGDMYYDDESVRRQARLEQLLSRPISDFELTVRSRNCLQGMNIHTLGDLTRISEQDLLNGKNFGETSLKEVRDLMAAHDLAVGQNLGKPRPLPAYLERDLSPQEQAVLSKSVNELNLSVRARKCMARLGITTVGELVQKTPDELLSTRNFGVTSLNELRSRLGEMNLKLRND
jgi:DNA-directed RNA polymerase subunit alpha